LKQIDDIQSRVDALYESIELRQFSMEDLKPRLLRHKAVIERLTESKNDLERQLGQNLIPDMDANT